MPMLTENNTEFWSLFKRPRVMQSEKQNHRLPTYQVVSLLIRGKCFYSTILHLEISQIHT